MPRAPSGSARRPAGPWQARQPRSAARRAPRCTGPTLCDRHQATAAEPGEGRDQQDEGEAAGHGEGCPLRAIGNRLSGGHGRVGTAREAVAVGSPPGDRRERSVERDGVAVPAVGARLLRHALVRRRSAVISAAVSSTVCGWVAVPWMSRLSAPPAVSWAAVITADVTVVRADDGGLVGRGDGRGRGRRGRARRGRGAAPSSAGRRDRDRDSAQDGHGRGQRELPAVEGLLFFHCVLHQ